MGEMINIGKIENTKESIKAARAELMAQGLSRMDADEFIFIELGGGDAIKPSDDGVSRYHPSGIPVDELKINWP